MSADESGAESKRERRVMTGRIVTASHEDGVDHGPLCGLEECQCPDHHEPPRPAGTYVTVRLDGDAPIGLWRVVIEPEPSN